MGNTLIPKVKTKTLETFRIKTENLIFTKPLTSIAVLDLEIRLTLEKPINL